MRYAGIIKNDISAGDGVCLTIFLQGCPIHCVGCHNQSAWDFNGGRELSDEIIDDMLEAINANGIMRPLCIMGGEPMCKENVSTTAYIIKKLIEKYAYLPIYVWTGYTYEQLDQREDEYTKYVLDEIDYLIDGPFVLSQRDTTLKMRGSANQRIINIDEVRH